MQTLRYRRRLCVAPALNHTKQSSVTRQPGQTAADVEHLMQREQMRRIPMLDESGHHRTAVGGTAEARGRVAETSHFFDETLRERDLSVPGAENLVNRDGRQDHAHEDVHVAACEQVRHLTSER